MFFGNRCGRRGYGIFGCLCGGRRRRCGCDRENFGCERFESFDSRCGGFQDIVPLETGRRAELALERADFDGFFPEAKFVRIERKCGCRCC